MKKNKYKITLFVFAAMLTLGAIFSKVILPNAISETTTLTVQTEHTAKNTTEIIHTTEEYVTTKIHTTSVTVAEIISALTEAPTTTKKQEEISTAPPEWSLSKCVIIKPSIFLIPLSFIYFIMFEFA